MGFFDFLKPKHSSDHIVKEVKPFTLDNIFGIIDLTSNEDDANRLKAFLENRRLNNENEPTEADEFFADEFLDFMAEEDLYFFGHFDWKEESVVLDEFICVKMLQKFNIDISEQQFCDLEKLNGINQVYRIYGEILEKYNVTMCSIDIDSDSYQVVLVATADHDKLRHFVDQIGFKFEHHSEEW